MARVEITEMIGVVLHFPVVNLDDRGTFTKYFDRDRTRSFESELSLNSLSIATNSEAGTLRGLHFQISPYQEEKVIICLHGAIFDVVVDLREGSPTMGSWATIELNSERPASLFLPKGFAHGYQTLTPDSKVFYGLSSEYRAAKSLSLLFSDKNLNISWPFPVSQISVKDSQGISLEQALNEAKPA